MRLRSLPDLLRAVAVPVPAASLAPWIPTAARTVRLRSSRAALVQRGLELTFHVTRDALSCCAAAASARTAAAFHGCSTEPQLQRCAAGSSRNQQPRAAPRPACRQHAAASLFPVSSPPDIRPCGCHQRRSSDRSCSCSAAPRAAPLQRPCSSARTLTQTNCSSAQNGLTSGGASHALALPTCSAVANTS